MSTMLLPVPLHVQLMVLLHALHAVWHCREPSHAVHGRECTLRLALLRLLLPPKCCKPGAGCLLPARNEGPPGSCCAVRWPGVLPAGFFARDSAGSAAWFCARSK